MSKTWYFFLLLFIACKAAQPNADQSRTSEVETGQEEVLTKVDTMNNPDDLNPQVEEPEYVIIDYSQFKELDFNPSKLSEKEFQSFLLSDTSSCDLNNFGLYETTNCDEICETFLVELNNERKTAAPSDFDQGVLGMNFSPACEKLVVCSSYDGPDYDNYYHHRAEIVVFRMTENYGLDALAPSTRITFNNWSIENYAWINKNELALKLYSSSRYASEQNQDFAYFRLNISAE